MRASLVHAVLLVGLVFGGFFTTGSASAADLDYRTGAAEHRPFPEYFGLYEPWSRSEERPPRKGVWFYTQKPPKGINYLIPMGKRHEYTRPEPWTPAWYHYCAERWPSFNPDTGTIVTPDGVRMCM
jgi:hypothetical protein